jgi:hypothetical protein
MYEENLDEERNKKISDSGMGKSVDLMKKLTDYLNR